LRRIVVNITIIFLMTFLFAGVCYAAGEDMQSADSEQSGLTLSETMEMALIKSIQLEQAEKDEERAEEVRHASRSGYIRGVANTPMTGELYVSASGAGEPFFQFLSADAQWGISKKMLEIAKDSITLQAKKGYFDVLQKQQKVVKAQVELDKAQRDYRSAAARKSVGMASTSQVQGAKAAVEQKASNLEQARADLEKAYRSLNKLIGNKPTERPELVTPIEYEKLEPPALENKIATALSSDNNPYMWVKEENYDLSKYTWTFAQVEEAGLIDTEKANLSYQDAQKDMRNTIHELYDTLKTLEASYESAKQAVTSAESALATTQAMFNVGMVTKSEVLEKKATLETAKDGLLKVKSLYAITKETFEKPWLAVTTAGAGSSSQAT